MQGDLHRDAHLDERLRPPNAELHVGSAAGAGIEPPGVDRRQLPAVRPLEVDQPASGQVELEDARRLGVDGRQRVRGDRGEVALQKIARHYRFLRLPMPSEEGEAAPAGDAGADVPPPEPAAIAAFLAASISVISPLGEQEHPCGLVDLGVAAAQPFQRHHGVFDLFVPVVKQHRP